MLTPGDRLGVAVSGGADSVCLLRLLLELRAELGLVLHVVHFDHQIRPDSADDAKFVAELAANHSLPIHVACGDTPAHAATHRQSLEAAARELRYRFFDSLLTSCTLDKIATAHTLNDQSETVLMKLLRGAGARGLSAIHPVLPRHRGAILRPLLFATHDEIEGRLASLAQPFRTDSTNTDLAHTRNRVRHTLMPLLREFNPEVDVALAQTAEVLRAEDEYLNAEAVRAFPFLVQPGEPVRGGGRNSGATSRPLMSLSLEALARHPLAMQRRLVRLALAEHTSLTLADTERILALITAPSNTLLELPCALRVRRLHRELQVFRADTEDAAIEAYEVAASFTGEPLTITAHTVTLEIRLSDSSAPLSAEPRTLPLPLILRPWRAGDRFLAPHTRTAKKVKDHLQALKLTTDQRSSWPVLEDASSHQILWLRGYSPARIALASRLLEVKCIERSAS
ncbi:MAG: tRNA lysidine(34) synthetase TilS [Acidobacteriaceae bacterium]